MTARRPRQRLRKALLLLFLLLFPVVLNFLSPYLSLSGALRGTVSGSLLFFGLLLASSLLLGRAFCGWVCPGGALQEMCFAVNDRRVKGARLDWVKYLVWAPWLGLVLFGLLSFGAARGLQVRPRYMMDSWVSIEQPGQFVVYYGVLFLIAAPALILGRRGMCHAICWMAPFMVLGRKLRNLAGWPALRLEAETQRCASCGTCTEGCPMSLPVQNMVAAGIMERAECVLCGRCVDGCPQSVIRYRFCAGNRGR